MRLAGVVDRARRPKTTVRWRLTLLYGGLFLISGAVLLAITYTLVDSAAVFPQGPRITSFARHRPLNAVPAPSLLLGSARPAAGSATIEGLSKTVPAPIQRLLRTAEGQKALGEVVFTQHVADLHQLIIESAIALALMALLSTALGWVVAGRVLRPLRTMTMTTQEISEENLNRRLAMSGPPDELRQLADTIDGLLGRLEGAFDAQRRFVANASHELRTPLTAVRALLEMVLADPRATVATFRATCEQVLEESEHEEQLIDALLTLAQGQRGVDVAQAFDLADVVNEVLESREGAVAADGLVLESSVNAAPVAGDARLAARLASNLIDNAIRHNVAQGRVAVRVGSVDPTAGSPAAGSLLAVTNTGPVVPADEVDRLLGPFQRMATARTGHGDGLGLGLSIVDAIADAHGASLSVRARPEGGLEVVVRFPVRSTPLPASPRLIALASAEPDR
jgi:signal transduction histidine kinase